MTNKTTKQPSIRTEEANIYRSSPKDLMNRYAFLNRGDNAFNRVESKIFTEIKPIEFFRWCRPLKDGYNTERIDKLRTILKEALSDPESETASMFFYNMFLDVDVNKFRCCGHEGRHRSLALILEDVQWIPMVFNLRVNGRYDWVYDDTFSDRNENGKRNQDRLKQVVFNRLKNNKIKNQYEENLKEAVQKVEADLDFNRRRREEQK